MIDGPWPFQTWDQSFSGFAMNFMGSFTSKVCCLVQAR